MEVHKMDSFKNDEIIPVSEVEEIKAGLEEGDLAKAVEAIGKSLEKIDGTPLNIAVTGESGAGKSTFINAIRGMEDDDEEGAALTGVVETTLNPTPYNHPVYKNVIFWDLPGVGTPNFTPQIYLEAVDFRKYDFFIIMASERFRLNNSELAKEIQKMDKKFYFVRTKIDSDLAGMQKRKKNTFNEDKILQEIRENCMQCLIKAEIKEPRVFLLSCLELDKYDFGLMQEILEQELPSNKRHVFLLSLPNISMPILEKKRKALKKNIWKLATLSCGVATIPIPGLSVACDIAILVAAMKQYLDAFGLTQRSIEKLAKKFGKDVKELKSVIKSPLVFREINAELVKSLLARSVVGAVMLVEYALSAIPILGSLAAGGLSFATTYKMLCDFLKEIAEDAVRVLHKAVEVSV
ncbi:interferon-inducible GTPase 5-like [Lithobates pipiens]